MHRPRFRSIGLFVVATFGLIVSMFAFSPAANAGVATPGCAAGVSGPGAQISQYPRWGGTQSGWKIACVFQSEQPSPPGANDVSSNFSYHDFPTAIYHNGNARAVSFCPSAGACVAGTTTIPSGTTQVKMTDPGTNTVSCAGTAGFINRSIGVTGGGGGIAPRTFVTSVTASPGCVITLNQATTATITAGVGSFLIDNSNARSVDDATTGILGSTVISSPSGNCQASDATLSVSGSEIAPGTTVVSCNGTGWNITPGTIGADISPGTDVITIGGTQQSSDTREFGDATFTAANTVHSAAAKFKADDVGMPIKSFGTNAIPQPCYITAVSGAGLVNATVTCTLTVDSPALHRTDVGVPTSTAPNNDEQDMQQLTQLALDPVLVAGSPDCTQDQAAGFAINGKWRNPGSFTINLLATQPANTRAVGEILFPTPVGLNYGAFIIERDASGGSATEPQTAKHYDVVFPNVPTSSALCASPTSPGLGFTLTLNPTVLSEGTLPTGTGRPGTAQVRAIKDDAQAGNAPAGVTAFLTDNATNLWYPNPGFSRICITPAGAPTVDFSCGTG
jgi:hypothetical protein